MQHRARLQVDKDLKRDSILAAAESLVDLQKHSLPQVSEIAKKAGLAKGTVYIYFRTKEEIYLSLLARGFAKWLGGIKAALSTPNANPETILTAYCDFCVNNPKTLFLASLASTILENNIPEEVAYEFKRSLAQETRNISEQIEALFPGVSCGYAAKLFIYSYALTLGLWQHAHPSPVIEKVFKKPELSILRINFGDAIHAALNTLWKGALST